MNIKSLQFDPNKNCYVVEVAKAPRLFLSIETVEAFKLSSKSVLSEELYDKLRALSQIQEAKQYTLRYVSQRMVSSMMLSKKLKERRFDQGVIEEVIAWAKEFAFINDAQFLHYAVKDAIEFKRFGKHKVVQVLMQKGFAKDEIVKVYDTMVSDETQQSAIRYHIEKKWPTIRGNSEMHKKKKMIDFLLRKGFNYNDIKSEMGNLDEWM